MLSCFHLEIFNNFLTRGPRFSFCTRSYKLYSQACPYRLQESGDMIFYCLNPTKARPWIFLEPGPAALKQRCGPGVLWLEKKRGKTGGGGRELWRGSKACLPRHLTCSFPHYTKMRSPGNNEVSSQRTPMHLEPGPGCAVAWPQTWRRRDSGPALGWSLGKAHYIHVLYRQYYISILPRTKLRLRGVK